MEVQLFGPTKTTIGPGCKGTVGDGSCYFDEFVKHISPTWKGSTTIGTNLEPDAQTIATALQQSKGAMPYNYVTDLRQLLSGVNPTEKATFSLVWTGLGDAINTCRNNAAFPKVALQWANVKQSMGMVHDARWSDQAAAMINNVNEELADLKAGFVRTCRPWAKPLLLCSLSADCFHQKQVETKWVQGPSGVNYREIDTAATLSAHPGATKQVRAAIVRIINRGGANPKQIRVSQSHLGAIQVAQAEDSRVHRAPTC